MDKASTDWRIQSQPAKLLTLSGLAANWANSASIAACLAKSWPYTLPSTLLRRYSNTRSAGFNSGEYGGCSINLTGTSSYTSPRWPRARSQTKTVKPSAAHCLTTGAIEAPCIFSVQSQRSWPVRPLTAKFKYAHSRLYSTGWTTFTPRGAHTRRTWPISPTRISSPQAKPAGSEQSLAWSWSVRPLFSRLPAGAAKLGGIADGVLWVSTLTDQRPSACPNNCIQRHNSASPRPRLLEWFGFRQPRLWPLVRLPGHRSAIELDPRDRHANGLTLRPHHLADTRPPILAPSGNAPRRFGPLGSWVGLGAATTTPVAGFAFGNLFPVYKVRTAFVRLLATQFGTVEPFVSSTTNQYYYMVHSFGLFSCHIVLSYT